MIVVTDVNGEVHEYHGDELAFETEDITNNLLVTTEDTAALFAAGQWRKLEMNRDA